MNLNSRLDKAVHLFLVILEKDERRTVIIGLLLLGWAGLH